MMATIAPKMIANEGCEYLWTMIEMNAGKEHVLKQTIELTLKGREAFSFSDKP